MKRTSIITLSLFTLAATPSFGRAPQIPKNTDYATLSAEEQKELEAAAFLLNLKALGILDPKGPICASVSKDQNGNPRYQFSIQGDAFETGSCALKSTQDTVKKLQKLAQASSLYYKEVRNWESAVPLDVYGFSDGQNFPVVGQQAAKACPELAQSKAVGGSYNLPLAQTRAERVVSELKLDKKFDVKVKGFNSPALEKGSVACATRRQVVISMGGATGTETLGNTGVYEPAARVDDTVQLAMNSAVSLQILRAHEKLKSSSDCNSLKKKDREVCQWNHMQKVLTSLGIAENDIACRSTTLALADEVISRADSPFSTGKKNQPWQDEMLSLARDPEKAGTELRAFIEETSKKDKDAHQLYSCASSGILHIAVPTSDMFEDLTRVKSAEIPTDPNCKWTSPLSGLLSDAEKARKEKKPLPQIPGMTSANDLIAYRRAKDPRYPRRNLTHNCVKPDPAILAIGYELSPNRKDFFRDPATLGADKVELKYTADTFSSTYHPKDKRKGFGCTACGSGIFLKGGKLQFDNDIVSMALQSRQIFGEDGTRLIGSKEATAASFLSPTVYEIPNCAGCKCISSGKSSDIQAALSRALVKPPLLQSEDLASASRTIEPKKMSQSCLFTPAVSHACPVGPTGHSEQAKVAGASDVRLKYIDKSLNMSSASLAGGLHRALDTIVKSCSACDVEVQNREVADYQSLVNEVVCETKSPPIRLPSAEPGKEAADCRADTETSASSVR